MDSSALVPLPASFAATVASLHRVAEAVVSPARKPDKEIALVPTTGGFGTPEFEFEGTRQRVRVEGRELVREVDGKEQRTPLTSLAQAGAIVSDLLPSDTEPGKETLDVDPAASFALGAIYRFGADALAQLLVAAAPEDAATSPRLWPEHFDIAIELGSDGTGARANYGLSPGDGGHPEPYLYVGPWSATVSGDLWQASGFSGAELSYAQLVRTPDPQRGAIDFFVRRRDALVSNGGSRK